MSIFFSKWLCSTVVSCEAIFSSDIISCFGVEERGFLAVPIVLSKHTAMSILVGKDDFCFAACAVYVETWKFHMKPQ